MNGQIPQPQNRGEATLVSFWWAWKIQLGCLALFATACFGFVTGVFLYRLTVWVLDTYLARPF